MRYEKIILEPSFCGITGEAVYQKPQGENQVGIVDCADLSKRFGQRCVLEWDVAFRDDELIVFAESDAVRRMTSSYVQDYNYLIGVWTGIRPVSYLLGSDFNAVDRTSREILSEVRSSNPDTPRKNYGLRHIHIGGEFPDTFVLSRIERKYFPR